MEGDWGVTMNINKAISFSFLKNLKHFWTCKHNDSRQGTRVAKILLSSFNLDYLTPCSRNLIKEVGLLFYVWIIAEPFLTQHWLAVFIATPRGALIITRQSNLCHESCVYFSQNGVVWRSHCRWSWWSRWRPLWWWLACWIRIWVRPQQEDYSCSDQSRRRHRFHQAEVS